MKINEYSPYLDEKGEIPLVERIRNTVRFGSSWYADQQSQETITSRLQMALDDSFLLLRNLTLEGLDVPIPLILVGPTGVHVIYPSSLKGIYQVNADQWRVMDTGSKRFKLARPNLINRSLLLSRAVERHLERCGYKSPLIEPLIVFTDPGVHVDTKRPAVRTVMVDALDRFSSGLAQQEGVVSPENVRKVVKLLTNPPADLIAAGGRTEEDRLLQKALTSRSASTGPGGAAAIDVPFLGPISFSSRQWIVLGVLAFLNVVLLTVFIFLVLAIS
jgi:hypothetical protein